MGITNEQKRALGHILGNTLMMIAEPNPFMPYNFAILDHVFFDHNSELKDKNYDKNRALATLRTADAKDLNDFFKDIKQAYEALKDVYQQEGYSQQDYKLAYNKLTTVYHAVMKQAHAANPAASASSAVSTSSAAPVVATPVQDQAPDLKKWHNLSREAQFYLALNHHLLQALELIEDAIEEQNILTPAVTAAITRLGFFANCHAGTNAYNAMYQGGISVLNRENVYAERGAFRAAEPEPTAVAGLPALFELSERDKFYLRAVFCHPTDAEKDLMDRHMKPFANYMLRLNAAKNISLKEFEKEFDSFFEFADGIMEQAKPIPLPQTVRRPMVPAASMVVGAGGQASHASLAATASGSVQQFDQDGPEDQDCRSCCSIS